MDKMSNIIIVLFSLIGIVLEIVMFAKILHNGPRIFKYYTLLSNFLFLIVSIISVVYVLLRNEFPIFVQGLYLMTTLGLTLTMFVYWAIIYPRERSKKDTVSQASGISGVSDFASNLVWHTICPIFSIICLLLLPKKIGSEWIFIAIVPTAIYFVVYVVFTFTRVWDEPYGFLIENRKISKKGFILCAGIVVLALVIVSGLYQVVGLLA